MPPVIDHEKCNACGICDEHCPLDVLYLEDDVFVTPMNAGTAGPAARTARRVRLRSNFR